MRNVDYRDSIRLQPADDFIKHVDLIHGQLRCGLVHDHDLRILRYGLYYFYQLLIRGGEPLNLDVRVDFDSQAIKCRLCFFQQLFPVYELAKFFAQVYVFRHRQRRDQRTFLVNDGNAIFLRQLSCHSGEGALADLNLPFVIADRAGQHLNQRRFSRAVFAHERVDFTRFNFNGHIVQCDNAGIPLCNIPHG